MKTLIVPELVTTYLRFAVSHVLQYQLEHLHCIFLLLFVSSENHRLFDWVLGGRERKGGEGEGEGDGGSERRRGVEKTKAQRKEWRRGECEG